ncbi:TonB-dependent receptor [Hymenobacter caeli]|uniref:Outer membrane receptor protein involved in Fe transport n=1 Tax=Hymenobacter caeli TaxID=2735894 RepID=A0ABX2FL96_9BACT|nr:TonB-dependent receptor [Hymenobacter caeli]NRT17613.1 outer membrane receptor protein involved in Fe transport [Hymenobacter caeli]
MKKQMLPPAATPHRAAGRLLLGAALLAGAASAARAQAAAPADTLQRQRLNEVVVTANRAATPRRQVPQQIQIIGRQDIRQTPADEFTDVLKKNASVDVVQYPGLLAGVGIRGFRPQTDGLNQRALLLVDGRPAGTSNLATLDLGGVERVEILKGPASALYGPQAMGGVVNVITRQSRGKIRTSLFGEYGSFQTVKFGGATGGNITKKLDFDLSGGFFNRGEDYKLGGNGILRRALGATSATRTYVSQAGTDSLARTDDARSDGQRRAYTKMKYYSGALRLGYQLSAKWRVDVRGELFNAPSVQAPNDLFYGNLGPSTKDIERGNLDLSATGNYKYHQLFVRGYTSKETSNINTLADYNYNPVPPYRSYQSEYIWKGVQAKDVIKLGRQSLTVGIDHNEATSNSQVFNPDGTSGPPYSPNYALTTTGLYAQGQLSLLSDKLVLTPGLRYDFVTYNVKQTDLLTDFTPGKKTNPFFSPSLGAQLAVVDGLRAHATIGRAYVTPDAFNVAGFSRSLNPTADSVAISQGNANLKNENSVTYDAGLRFDKPTSGFSADVTFFATRVNDRITTRTANPVGETTAEGYVVASRTTYVNADNSQIRGLESEFGYDFGVLADRRYLLRVFTGGTTIYKAQDVTNNVNGTRTVRDIYNVARLNGNLGVAFDSYRGLSARLAARYVGRRKDTDYTDFNYPEIETPEYMTIDFSAGYTVAKYHTFSLLVSNLTNENYYEKRGYNLPGRSFSGRYTVAF